MSEWKKIVRISRTIPFGYELDPEDPNVLLPISLELDALELAKKHLKSFSYREVANWLTAVTNRPISHVGLRKRISNERSRRQAASTTKQWAARYKKAEETARKLEEERLGAKES
jgi:hypothetical protein